MTNATPQRKFFAALSALIAAGFAFGGTTADGAGKPGCPAELVNRTLPPVTVLKAPDGKPIELVKDGKLQFVLVGDLAKEAKIKGPEFNGKPLTIARYRRDSRRRAVNLLQEAFKATTGEAPAFAECDSPAVTNYRYVVVCGKCRYTDELGFDPDKLPREGFRIQTFAKGVVIAGMDGFEIPGVMDNFNWRCGRMNCNGTELGAVDFAERFLGIRKYGFADEKDKTLTWEHMPQVANLTVPPCAYEDHPRQRLRGLRTPWRGGCSSSFFGGEAPTPSSLIKAHPDRLEDIFYRTEDGRLCCNEKSYGGNFLDFSNPKLADILVEDIREYYKNDSAGSYWGTTHAPSGDYLWIGQCDNGMVIKNERTAKIPPAKGPFPMSEVYGHFYKYFAEKCEEAFPGKTVVLMAYSNYLTAPTSIEKLPDNVQILCCLGSPAFARSAHFQKIWKETYRGWNRLTKKKCVPYTYDVSYSDDEVIQHAIRGYFEGEFYRVFKDEIDPEHTYNCTYNGGKPYHYSAYLASRGMWNPDFDVDAALEEYFRLMYGPAAGKAREFYYGILDRWINHYLPYDTGEGKSRLQSIPMPIKDIFNFKTFEPGAVHRLLALLDEGEKLVAKDSLEGRRFASFARPFRNQLEDILAFQNIKPISLDVPKAKSAPTVDGVLDEADWATVKLPAFHHAYAGGPRPCISPETALRWDEKGLYFASRSPQPYDGDSIEVMLAPAKADGKVFNLYQFLIFPNGVYQDTWTQIDPPRNRDYAWGAPNAKYAAKAEKDFWTGELFVPWTDLSQGEVPKAGDTWKVNVIYNRKKPYEYISLAPTQNNNSRIDLYANITFRATGEDLAKTALPGNCKGCVKLKFMTFNLWGNYFGNPVHERDTKEAEYVLRNAPDIVAMQEVMPEFWNSRLFKMLEDEYGIVHNGKDPKADYNPLLYRKRRLELIESGTHLFAAKDNPEKVKGFAWAVLKDKATGKSLIAYSTHFWWRSKPLEERAKFDHMRVNNARELLAKVGELKKKYGELPVVGGGDLNTTENVRLSGRETPLNDWLAAGYCDAQFAVPGASPWSSHHGDPKRDASGVLRGYICPDASDPKNSLDHVHYAKDSVKPLSLVVDRAQDVLECSDHSPVIFTFALK